jgi:hypothetical protein
VPEGVEATARNGDLTLTGTAQYLSQRASVEKVVVSGLIGVRHVRNEIDIVCDVERADVPAQQVTGPAGRRPGNSSRRGRSPWFQHLARRQPGLRLFELAQPPAQGGQLSTVHAARLSLGHDSGDIARCLQCFIGWLGKVGRAGELAFGN